MKLICTSCDHTKHIVEKQDSGNTIYCLCHECLIKMGKKQRTGRNKKKKRKQYYL